MAAKICRCVVYRCNCLDLWRMGYDIWENIGEKATMISSSEGCVVRFGPGLEADLQRGVGHGERVDALDRKEGIDMFKITIFWYFGLAEFVEITIFLLFSLGEFVEGS